MYPVPSVQGFLPASFYFCQLFRKHRPRRHWSLIMVFLCQDWILDFLILLKPGKICLLKFVIYKFSFIRVELPVKYHSFLFNWTDLYSNSIFIHQQISISCRRHHCFFPVSKIKAQRRGVELKSGWNNPVVSRVKEGKRRGAEFVMTFMSRWRVQEHRSFPVL